MAATDLHDSFWVAIAAAAPVIGLASAVTADQTARRSERAMEQWLEKGPSSPERPRVPRVIYAITYLNMALQTAALLFALYSLGTHHDIPRGRLIAALLTGVGMVLVFAPTWLTTLYIYKPLKWARKA